jgi:hypothetical protein
MTPRGYWRAAPTWERRDVTVCIAAACDMAPDRERKIVLCFDWKVSTAIGSSETKYKMKHLGKDWVALWSGNESDIMLLGNLFEKEFRGATDIDETNAVQLVRNGISLRKREKAEELTQGRFALSYDDFLKIGKNRLPSDLYRDTLSEIGNLRLGAQAIVCGFTASDVMIIETDEEGKVALTEDFAAIGEGAYLAQSVLLQRGHIDSRKLDETLYVAYEAKRYAERVSSVGKRTTIFILSPTQPLLMVYDAGLDFLSQMFDQFGPKNLPKDIELKPQFLGTLKGAWEARSS